MSTSLADGPSHAFQTLRRLAPKVKAAEQCGLCHELLAPVHEHLIDPRTRRLICSCQPCAILFDRPETQYKRVPRDVRLLADFQVSDAEWDALSIPIGIAFFVKHGVSEGGAPKLAAYYPSPAGAVESLLSLESWGELDRLQSDTEALLVNRTARESFILPIDECYRLVGLIRAHWRGLSGGAEVWRAIQSFFEEMKSRAHA